MEIIQRDLLRRAGEHLGTLAEEARNRRDLALTNGDRRRWNQHQRLLDERFRELSRLSNEVLEIANG